jgi:PKD repeat protein
MRRGILVFILLFAALAGCGTRDRTQVGQNAAPQVEASGLPGVPREPQLSSAEIVARRPNGLVSTRRMGVSTYRQGVLAEAITGESLRIGSHEPNSFGWAMYQFTGFTELEPVSAAGVAVTPGAPGRTIWVAYCDFGANRWVMNEVPAEVDPDGGFLGVNVTVPFASAHRPVSDSGNVYIAVLSYSDVITINSVDIVYEDILPPPVEVTATVGTEVGAVLLTWEDPAITYDPDGAGPGTFKYDAVRIERSPDGIGSWTGLPDQAAGVTEFSDGNQTSSPPLPGVTYHYRLRTLRATYVGRPSETVMGRIGVLPSASFSATPTSGEAPAMVSFDAGSSIDADGLITNYRWSVAGEVLGETASPDFSALMDFAETEAVVLEVTDNDGHQAEFFLPLSAVQLVDDNPAQPDPDNFGMLTGGPGAYGLQLSFIIKSGMPNYRVELDSNYLGHFGSEAETPTVLLKDFGTAPNVSGPYTLFASLPSTQGPGTYYIAIRVTDSSTPANSGVYVWPRRLHL